MQPNRQGTTRINRRVSGMKSIPLTSISLTQLWFTIRLRSQSRSWKLPTDPSADLRIGSFLPWELIEPARRPAFLCVLRLQACAVARTISTRLAAGDYRPRHSAFADFACFAVSAGNSE